MKLHLQIRLKCCVLEARDYYSKVVSTELSVKWPRAIIREAEPGKKGRFLSLEINNISNASVLCPVCTRYSLLHMSDTEQQRKPMCASKLNSHVEYPLRRPVQADEHKVTQ